MFPSALLMARVRKDGLHPVFLGEEMTPQAEAVQRIFRESVGRSRRDIEVRIRELESKVDKYKVIRGLALLVERRASFSPREGPAPPVLRRRLFDVTQGAAITPEERARVLAQVAPEFALSPQALAEHPWGDLEEEEILRSIPALDPGDLLRRFNLGQCQTLLFRATQMSLTFGTPEAYRLAVTRIKRQGLMFTAEEATDGKGPVLQVEGVVSFLRSTERYGTRLAQILPEMLALPGWALASKVLYRDSMGRKRHLDFRLDAGMAGYLNVNSNDTVAAPLPRVLEELALTAEKEGLGVDRSPPPAAMGGGLEYPDLALFRGEDSVLIEAVGYWSKDWLERKLQRTERAPRPYLIVAPKDLAVGALAQHRRLIVPKASGLDARHVLSLLPSRAPSRDPPRRELSPESLRVPDDRVLKLGEIGHANQIPPSQAQEILEARGFLCAGGCALDPRAVPQVREQVRGALPNFGEVERVLLGWKLPLEILSVLGFVVKWKGLEASAVAERQPLRSPTRGARLDGVGKG